MCSFSILTCKALTGNNQNQIIEKHIQVSVQLVRRVLCHPLINMENWQKYLESIYHDPASFMGPETLYKVVLAEGKFKIGIYHIRKWLQDQESYSLIIGARRKYNRSRVIVNGINSQADMDLMDMVDLAKQNDGYQYLLVCIIILSRFAQRTRQD